MENIILVQALEYAERHHFSVIPVQPVRKPKPYVRWRRFQQETANREAIKGWFKQWPKANVAIVTGNISNLVVVDADTEDATRIVEGLLPDGFRCPLSKTPRGGRHFYFKFDPRIETTTGIIRGLDIRAEGGFVVAPPSKRRNANPYEWLTSPAQCEVPPMPEQLLEFLLSKQEPQRTNSPDSTDFLSQGRRDNDLFHTALSLAKGGLSQEEVEQIVCRLAATAEPPFDAEEAKKKVISAFQRLEKRGRGVQTPILRTLSEVEPQRVQWLWPNLVPQGKLSLLVGDPGIGKSLLSIDIAAHLTSGSPWPDSIVPPLRGSVILLSGEDGIADTVRMRADAAGVDASKIKVLEGVRTGRGEEAFFSLENHMPVLERAIKGTPDVILVIVDPITAHLGGTREENSILRSKVLGPLSKLAARYTVAILAISHLKKDTAPRTLYRVLGSLAYVAAARSVLAVFKDTRTNDASSRILVSLKSNLSKDVPALAFSIREDLEGRPRISYDLAPVSLALVNNLTQGGDTSVVQEVMEWLKEVLKDGPVESTLVLERAKADNISEASLRRAKRNLNVKSERRESKWYFSLPTREDTGTPHGGNQAS